jgi:hypothetical protein
MGQPLRGRADYWKPGTWNASCSMCGRKRKADEMVRNWQGLYRCPEHDEPRQPQDFARGLPDNMGVPWAQLETDTYVQINLTFPASVSPSPLLLTLATFPVLDDPAGLNVLDENGLQVQGESVYIGLAVIVLPGWVIPTSYAWSWASGGAGITIDDPTQPQTYFQSLTAGHSGIAQCVITDSLGGVATVTLSVSD